MKGMRTSFLTGFVTVAALSLASAHGAEAVPVSPHTQAERGKVAGIIETVDVPGGQIALKTLAGTKKFTLAPDTRVLRTGRPAALSDLSKGEHVRSLRYDRKTNTTIRIDLGSR